MNTGIHDNTASAVGWLFYDGECPLCCASARRLARILAQRRIGLRPLQSAGAAQQLGLSDGALLRETRLLLADGRSFGGADAVVEIARHVWWAWPLWLVSRFPRVSLILHAAYSGIAARRHCVGGGCKIPRHRTWPDWMPLLVFPALAITVREALAPWVFMWLMACAFYAAFKWLSYRDALAQKPIVPVRSRILYLLCWPGMSFTDFVATPSGKNRPSRFTGWLAPVGRTLGGAGLVWWVVPTIPADAVLLRGWVGMIGIVLILHFGVFQLLALVLQAAGFNARPIMRSPLLARSLADFWSNRWNTAFNVLADRYVFRPLTPRLGPRTALAFVFLASGLLHEAVLTLPARGGYGLPTAYFGMQAAGIFLERLPFFRQRPGRKLLLAWAVLVVPLGLLFPTVFVRNVILPMLHAIGATGSAP